MSRARRNARGAQDTEESSAAPSSGRDPLGENAYTRIREAIRSGNLQPGDRVTESEIASWLSMSRTPVREAILRLEAEGLLTHAPRQGLVVARLDYQAVIELYTMRAVLEGTAARLAATHASDVEIEALRDMLAAEHNLDATQAKQASQLNRRFHETIYRAAHNRYLLKSLGALGDAMVLLGNTTLALPGRHDTALAEHANILKAISNRDPTTAEEVARDHIKAAQRFRLQLLLGEDDSS